MIEVLPKLYSRVGFLLDNPPKMDWMHDSKPYDLNCLADDLVNLSTDNLFRKLIEILTASRVNLEYFGPLIGEYIDLSKSIVCCDKPTIKTITQSTIYFDYLESEQYKLAKSFHFYFNEKVILDKSFAQISLKQDSFKVYPNLNITVSYPVFNEENIVYTNQLFVLYD